MILLLFGSFAAATMGAESSSPPADAAAFELKEISTFDAPEVLRSRLLVGAYCECQTEADKNVEAYPSFKSDKPLYGSLQVGGATTEPDTPYHYAFAFDESEGTGQGYDRLYLDTNRNGDLTDDTCLSPTKDVPNKALMNPGASNSGVSERCFEPLKLRVAPGDDPQHQLEVMPRFLRYPGSRSFAILTTTKAWMGEIEIGGERFTAVLCHTRGIPGRFDHPATGLFLLAPGDPSGRPTVSWYGGEQLMAMHRKGDTYYRLGATPSGDKLFVWPYQGAFGTLEVKAGQRSVERVQATGSLASEDIAVSLTEGLGSQTANRSNSFRVPVGDYAIQMLNVTYDKLNCLTLRNNHADGQPGGRAQAGPAVYAIKIREDAPFVLDFSGKPQVLFASPAKDCRVRAGEQLDVKAVLIDPALDIMFRAIRERDQLNPKVTIARANGQVVADGVMPFG
ncbi:MAG: hypothetical protein JW993_19460 [Sedimentisphaerales bacterium]|nr:hypothetical protein [Sedimentisphaerales bacterium]